MSDSRECFAVGQDKMKQLVEDTLRLSRTLGASDASVVVSEGHGLQVSFRCDELEMVEHNCDKGLSVTIYVGSKEGTATTSDFSKDAIKSCVEKAIIIARNMDDDDCAGLPEEEHLFLGDLPDLDLYHPWNMTVNEAVGIAEECERAAFAVSPQIKNSDGVVVSASQSQFILGTSRNFLQGYPSSIHSVSCAVVADNGDELQRDGWYYARRDASDFSSMKALGDYSARRALSRQGARHMSTHKNIPVLFDAPLAVGLLGAYILSVSGSYLYRKASFLCDSLGKQVFPSFVQIYEDPFVLKGLASSCFDNDGVMSCTRQVVENGIVNNYFLPVYYARKLNLMPTGHAGGSHNLVLQDTGDDFLSLLKKMGTGFLVTELFSQGINYVTGGYSRGAAGFWVENGEILYPVQEITIAGNLQDMFKNIVAIGSDQVTRGSKTSGSILVERMTLAGSL